MSEPFEIEVKRFYVPGYLEAECPACGTWIEEEYDGDSISYPTANVWIPYYAWCPNEECEHSTESGDEAACFEIRINLSVECRTPKKKK